MVAVHHHGYRTSACRQAFQQRLGNTLGQHNGQTAVQANAPHMGDGANIIDQSGELSVAEQQRIATR